VDVSLIREALIRHAHNAGTDRPVSALPSALISS
jgi:hypothetical protein